MKRQLIIWSLWSIFFLTCPVWAQDDVAADRVAALEAKIQQLEQRIADLEALIKTLTPTPTPVHAPVATGIPTEIEQGIRTLAAQRFPDDSSTQLYFIKQERKAYQDLQSYTAAIPAEEIVRLRQVAAQRFPGEYSTQIYYIKQEVEAYQELHAGE